MNDSVHGCSRAHAKGANRAGLVRHRRKSTFITDSGVCHTYRTWKHVRSLRYRCGGLSEVAEAALTHFFIQFQGIVVQLRKAVASEHRKHCCKPQGHSPKGLSVPLSHRNATSVSLAVHSDSGVTALTPHVLQRNALSCVRVG